MDWLVDLDGVVWRGDVAIPGADDAVARLRRSGPVWFCTNNSAPTVADHQAKLAGLGVTGDGILTSAMAVARLLRPGERVVPCADRGVEEAVRSVGARVVDAGPADAVVVGFHRGVDHAGLTRAVRAVLGGARLLATNDDPLYPDADGPAPGAGAILAAVERATGQRAVVAGKPNEAMVDLVRATCAAEGWVVGDSPATDGALARALGRRFALVLSGATAVADARAAEADLVATDLVEVAHRLAGGSGTSR